MASNSVDLSAVIQDSNAAKTALGDLSLFVSGAQKTNAALTEKAASDAESFSNAESQIADQKQIVIQEQENKRLAIAQRLGLDPTSSSYIAGKIADEVIQNKDRASAALDRINEKNQRSFVDNPLGFLHAKLTVNDDISEYNTAVQKQDLAAGTMRELEDMASKQFVISDSATITSNEANTAALKIKAGYAGLKDANDARLKGIRFNLDAQQVAANTTVEQARLTGQQFQATQTERAYQVQLAHLQLARSADLRAAAEHEMRKEAFDEKHSMDAYDIRAVQLGAYMQTGHELEGINKADLMARIAKKDPTIMSYYRSGQESFAVDPTGKTGVYSLNPLVAADLYSSNKLREVPAAQKPVLDRLVQLRAAFVTSPEFRKLDPKDVEGIQRAGIKFVNEQLQTDYNSGSPDSIYKPPSIVELAKTNKSVSNTALWNNVLKPLADAGARLDDPQFVINAAIGAMKDGKLSFPDFTDLAGIYGAGIAQNNANRNFIAMGLPKQTKYIANLQNGIYTDSVNMSDPAALATYVNKIAAKTVVSNRVQGAN